ncbi:carbohydrate binding domain-containing protein [Actinophytocola oryzae]|uniref:carbohydrate binding domain-containing protein n=1 Tax=Actinophytocola oryzae TaxID=502181 RepID=UPI001063B974|nr:carbohydrate binding domain-containing protein [Actinophytocola oryzae]
MAGKISAAEPGPEPTQARTPADFVADLNRLRVWAGQPSLRQLEKLSGQPLAGQGTEPLPSSTTSEILAGRRLPRLPRLEFVESFVAACLRARELDDEAVEQTVDRWRTAWRGVETGDASGRSWSPRVPAVVAAAVVIFAAGVLVGVTGTRLLDQGDSAASPTTTTAAPVASRPCLPPDEPPARGTVSMGPAGTPSVDDHDPADWWSNVSTVALTTNPKGFTVAVPSGSTMSWEVLAIRSGITLTAGHRYRFDFTASANRAVAIQTRIQDKAPPLYRPALVESVPVATTPCRRAYTFTVNSTSPATGEVTFQLGGQGAYTLTIDDPVLVDTSA